MFLKPVLAKREVSVVAKVFIYDKMSHLENGSLLLPAEYGKNEAVMDMVFYWDNVTITFSAATHYKLMQTGQPALDRWCQASG